jgi:hypothetical protein
MVHGEWLMVDGTQYRDGHCKPGVGLSWQTRETNPPLNATPQRDGLRRRLTRRSALFDLL